MNGIRARSSGNAGMPPTSSFASPLAGSSDSKRITASHADCNCALDAVPRVEYPCVPGRNSGHIEAIGPRHALGVVHNDRARMHRCAALRDEDHLAPRPSVRGDVGPGAGSKRPPVATRAAWARRPTARAAGDACIVRSLRHDPRARATGKRVVRPIERRDDDLAAAVREIRLRRRDLRSHAAGRKLAVVQVALRLGRRHPVDAALARHAEVERDAIDAREHHERLRAELCRKQGTRQVLVDHRRRTAYAPLASRTTGMPPPPPRSGSCPLQQRLDRRQLEDRERRRRRNDAAITAPRIFDESNLDLSFLRFAILTLIGCLTPFFSAFPI